MQWYNWFCVLFFFFCLFFNTDFVTWIITFYQLMLVVTRVMQRLLNPEHLVVLSAGSISHNSIHLLIITTDFVPLYWITGYVVFIITSFLASVESGDKCLLNSEFLSCFSGVIISIGLFFLLLCHISLFWSSLSNPNRIGRTLVTPLSAFCIIPSCYSCH